MPLEPRTSTARKYRAEPGAESVPRLALRPREAAAILGISERAFRRIQHEIPSVRRGRLVLYRPEAITGWLRRSESSDERLLDGLAAELALDTSEYDRESP
jgi:hypothetical protein